MESEPAANGYPLGCLILHKICCGRDRLCASRRFNQIFILIITFVCYAAYHASRKPISVVQPALHYESCRQFVRPASVPANDSHWCDWEPFDDDGADGLFSGLDYSFQFAYAFGMFFSGHFAERSNLRRFLFVGMMLSAITTALFGTGQFLNIHNYAYYLGVQLIGGVMQSTGWPAVIALISNWFGKARRGFIFGIWNSATSVGNIVGNAVSALFLPADEPFKPWGYAFVATALLLVVVAIVIFFFVISHPNDIGLPSTEARFHRDLDDESSDRYVSNEDLRPISFLGALAIPGVVEFSLGLFFTKGVSYSFLYWLPSYIAQTFGTDPQQAGRMASWFDGGGIVGGILAGHMSDQLQMPAFVCAIFLLASTPALFTLAYFPMINLASSLFVTGLLVNAPYALITTAVSAQLGMHESVRGSARALSTVTAIIDGTGSFGSAVGPLATGLLHTSDNWLVVFWFLIASQFCAILLLSRLIINELMARWRIRFARLDSDESRGVQSPSGIDSPVDGRSRLRQVTDE